MNQEKKLPKELVGIPRPVILALAESCLAIGKAQIAMGHKPTAREAEIMANAERELKLHRPV